MDSQQKYNTSEPGRASQICCDDRNETGLVRSIGEPGFIGGEGCLGFPKSIKVSAPINKALRNLKAIAPGMDFN
jgi:hypothetical protein